VPRNFKGSFERIGAARQRQLELRTERIANLSRLQDYLRSRLGEFLTNTDPITGSRLIDVGFEENRAHGGATLVVVIFEGSRMKITVDAFGRFTHAAMPDVFESVSKIVGLRVPEDLSKAEFDYIAANDETAGILTAEIDDMIQALIVRGAEALERDALEARAQPGAKAES